MVEQDARLSVKDIASCTDISVGSVQTILKKRLDPRKVCVVYMDLRPFQCAQFLGRLKLLKLGNFLLKLLPILEGLKPLLPRLTSLL